MPHSHSLPITTHADSASSGCTFESNYTSSGSENSSGFYCVPPNNEHRLPTFKSTLNTKTIFSFAWSDSNSNMSENSGAVVSPESPVTFEKFRHKPPTLPAPFFWSTLTHPDYFKDYIQAEGILQLQDPLDTEGSAQVPRVESSKAAPPADPMAQTYSNIATIESLNTSHAFVTENTPIAWIENSLFSDNALPRPFDPDLVRKSNIWRPREDSETGGDFFKTVPNLTEAETMSWLNKMGVSLGITHGILDTEGTEANDYGWTPASNTPFRTFNHGGRNRALTGGYSSRKPDMILLDRDHPYNSNTSTDRLDWGPVRALVEVSMQDSHYKIMMTTLLHKAANIFHSQLHRKYVLGLALFGKGDKMRYFFVIIDRAGALSTIPALFHGFDALTLARIVYGLSFGTDELLGIDPNVVIDRTTGAPLSVRIENQSFSFVKDIHVSPVLFGRGTRVYIVKDEEGHLHIFKDSWILMSHAKDNSEIEHLRNISAKAKKLWARGDSSFRSYLLHPRFVAGEEAVSNTNSPRGPAWVNAQARVRRRMVNGPIGDPITSYRSRVECLQVFIDVVDELGFLNDECHLLHGDISIGNIIIVRFLPNVILAALESDPINMGDSDPDDDLSAEVPSTICVPSTVISSASETPSTTLALPTVDPLVPSTATDKLANLCSPSNDNSTPGNPDSFAKIPILDAHFLHKLESGGSVIDFDYSRSRGRFSNKASGTVPYMSIELSRSLAGHVGHQDFEHRIDHDIESLLLVFLHIVRFTCGPKGDPNREIYVNNKEFNMTQWHHEPVVENIPHLKGYDIIRLRSPEDLAVLLPVYWHPISEHIIKLIDIVYPHVAVPFKTGLNIRDAFKKELQSALQTCRQLEDAPHGYGVSLPYQTRMQKKRKASTQEHRRAGKSTRSKRTRPNPMKRVA